MLPSGLSTKEALHRLHNDIAVELHKYEANQVKNEKKWFAEGTWMWDAYHHNSPYSTFSWTSGFMLFLEAVFLLICFGSNNDPRFDRLVVEAFVILVILLFNTYLVGWDSRLKHQEIPNKVHHLLNFIEENAVKCEMEHIQYPHLNMPLSPCITLQWTYRDNRLVNLHWSLLVQGDIIALRPGQFSPARCRPLENFMDGEELEFGQQFVSKSSEKCNKNFKFPRTCQPLGTKIFVVLETPYIKNLRLALTKSRNRPLSILDTERHLISSYWIMKVLIPLVVVTMLLVNVLRYIYLHLSVGTWIEMLILLQVQAVLPLLPLFFPLMWLVLNTYGMARLHTLFHITKETKIDIEPFDEFGEVLPMVPHSKFTWNALRSNFMEVLLGKGIFPTRTANFLHVLGNITVDYQAFCCIDKKGILSWPNPTAEKVFFLRSPNFTPDSSNLGSEFQSETILNENEIINHDEEEVNQSTDYASDNKSKTKPSKCEHPYKSDSIVEVLDLTHDNQIPFGLQFDDPKWKKFIKSLKPLGLSILLNTCNPATQDHYAQFSAHIAYEALDNDDVVPVVNRRCLCELARQIGFADQAMDVFQLQAQLSTFRPVQPDMARKDKIAKSLANTKLKFPFPHMVSVIMKECSSGMLQLLSQGTGDIILDSCNEYWVGNDLCALTESDRKKILDFYHRTSLTAYCTAFAYRPLPSPISTKFNHLYIELPADSSRLYPTIRSPTPTISWDLQSLDSHMKHSLIRYFSTDSILGYEHKEEPINDVDTCFKVQCNQIFIGMVTMQYQARTDIVHLIEQLDKACIRFVHFSKENELRSRVFSEKMGLESGWNCHISLLSEQNKHDSSLLGTSVANEEGNVCSEQRSKISTHRKPCGDYSSHLQTPINYSQNQCLHRSCSAPSVFNLDVAIVKFEDEISMHDVTASDSSSVCSSAWTPHRSKSHHFSSKKQEMDCPTADADAEEPLMSLCNDFEIIEDVNTSRSPSHVTESTEHSAPVAFDMSNRAKLPKGIENIRPHLENIDNVPLLVSLFTDCVPDATREMIKIMQEYGEVVCCLGSAANCHNMSIFLQADASIAVEPLYPQLCMKQPIFMHPSITNGAVLLQISHCLNSLTSSLSFYRDEPVSLYHLIMEARHFTGCMRNCFQFMLACCLSLTMLQMLTNVLLLPPILTFSHLLWFSCLIIPMLSLSLIRTPVPPQITTFATGKNNITIDKAVVLYFSAFTGIKFFPSIIVCIICFGMTLHNYCNILNSNVESCHLFYGNKNFTQSYEWNGWASTFRSRLNITQNFISFFLVLYFVCISTSYVHKYHQLWSKSPFENRMWAITIVLVLLLQFAYAVIDVSLHLEEGNSFNDVVEIPLLIWITGFAWPIALILFNENIKRYEIRSNVRYQKRARLEFGTKLGMNSPF